MNIGERLVRAGWQRRGTAGAGNVAAVAAIRVLGSGVRRNHHQRDTEAGGVAAAPLAARIALGVSLVRILLPSYVRGDMVEPATPVVPDNDDERGLGCPVFSASQAVARAVGHPSTDGVDDVTDVGRPINIAKVRFPLVLRVI